MHKPYACTGKHGRICTDNKKQVHKTTHRGLYLLLTTRYQPARGRSLYLTCAAAAAVAAHRTRTARTASARSSWSFCVIPPALIRALF